MFDLPSTSASGMGLPAPGSAEELRRFARIQERLAPLFRRVFLYTRAPRTVVVVSSLSLDTEELAKISGVHHYEEQMLCMLCMLMLLRMPRTHLVFVTTQPVATSIVDYYLHLLPGVPFRHARRRLTLLSCHDASELPLTQKILERPRLLGRIWSAIPDPEAAHITCFNSTPLERTLAVKLDIPLYANDPALDHLGSKSGGREVFREAGVRAPEGFEHLRDEGDMIEAIVELKRRRPEVGRVVIKLNQGFSGEGNAIFPCVDAPEGEDLARWVRAELSRRIRFEASGETWKRYCHKLTEMGGVVECFLEGGEEVRSPSVQCRIDPLGQVSIVSTYDQVVGGPSGQVFLGSTSPADAEYNRDIQDVGRRVAELLKKRGVLGRFAIDFLSIKREGRWEHAAKDQPEKRRYDPSLPDAAVPDRRNIRPREWTVLHAYRTALLLLRLGQPLEPSVQGPYPRRPGRHLGEFWPALRRRGPARRRVPPDRGALRVRQARYLMHRRQPRERRKVLLRHGRDPGP